MEIDGVEIPRSPLPGEILKEQSLKKQEAEALIRKQREEKQAALEALKEQNARRKAAQKQIREERAARAAKRATNKLQPPQTS